MHFNRSKSVLVPTRLSERLHSRLQGELHSGSKYQYSAVKRYNINVSSLTNLVPRVRVALGEILLGIWVSINFTVRRLQPGPPKDFQPIRNRSFNKELGVRTSTCPFRMVCCIHLPIFAVWLIFPNIQAAYTLKGWLYVLLGKGYKSALYLWGKSLVIQDVV